FDGDEAAEHFRLIDQPHPGVFEVRLRLATDPLASLYDGLRDGAAAELRAALGVLVNAFAITLPILVVEHPEWQRVAFGITGARIVYDCLDLATGFADARPSLAAAEAALLARADLVIAASCPLIQRIEEQHPGILVRNAAEVDFFAQAAADRPSGEFPVIGYFGAIAEWFAIDWIEACAVAKPAWRFRLIGQVDNCDVSRIAALPNVEFLGEVPYCELPALLREFDVAVIPFRLTPLTRFTNPVKLYEYMAAGKAVVASPLPELAETRDLVYLADDAVAFAAAIARALSEDSPALRARRRQWARRHDWSERARQFAEALATLTEPKGPGS
ncbi:MAG TPA: glycosyltransferase, partial [Stellaceae bacterium]|nr:glycosyltransferase [Stellaceae bacterium]